MLVQMKISLSLRFLVLFLGFCFVLSSVAVPTTRSLKSSEENPSAVQDFVAQDASMDMSDGEMVFDVDEGRMVLQNTDYPVTGPNQHHVPKTPGGA